jgi:hypothetical protein
VLYQGIRLHDALLFKKKYLCDLGSQLSSNRRRRSGSRTSHGSHGKTLRLSFEQKLGISNKEVERHEANLSHFRSVKFLKIFIHTGLQWYFVIKIVLTYCEKKMF